MRIAQFLVPLFVCLLAAPAITAEPTREEARDALGRATAFFHRHVAHHGGYVYATSGDLKLREGEGVVADSVIWVQPPGTPAVGEAFLDAYDATQDPVHLKAARAAAAALVAGQLHSGGWYYSIEFDPEKRRTFHYRRDLDGTPRPNPVQPRDRSAPAAWDEWKHRKYEGNQTTLDDDTTQAALRFLTRIDGLLKFEDQAIHDAALFGLKSLVAAQYPNGGWSANYDRFPEVSPPVESYPIVKASYPDSWPRTWPKDFTGCYVTNDNLMSDTIATLLRAHELYDDPRYLAAAERAGAFLLLAQMPEPQPAWAQQYDRLMQPVWSRAFEPPGVSGRESQTIMQALLALCRGTGDRKYLEPIPAAVAYLRRSQLSDGRLSRFYELRTNRPLYFTRRPGGGFDMTYSDARLASNYGFIVDNQLEAIEAEYQRLKSTPSNAAPPAETLPASSAKADLAAEVRRIIDSLDERGAWVERRRLRHHKIEPPSGVIDSQTFAAHVRTLCRFIEAH